MADDLGFLDRFGAVLIDSYFVVDRERRIQRFNSAFLQMLGLRPSQRRTVQGTPCFKLLNLEICRQDCIALKCLSKNAPCRMEEIQGKTPDGRDIVLELSAMPLYGADQQVAAVLVIHRDVTDERHLKIKYDEAHQDNKNRVDVLLKLVQERDRELAELRQKPR